jgi:hypothetical protein
MNPEWGDSDQPANADAEPGSTAAKQAPGRDDVPALRATLEELLAEDWNRGTLLRVLETVTTLVDALPEERPPETATVNQLVDVAASVNDHEFGAGATTFGLQTLAAETLRRTTSALVDVAADHPEVVLDCRYAALQDVFGDADRPVREPMARFYANLLREDADAVMTTADIDAEALAKHSIVLLAATNEPESAFLDRQSTQHKPMRAAAFVVLTAAEYVPDRIAAFLKEDIVTAMPPEYVSGTLIDVTLARVDRTELATPLEYIDDFTGVLHSDTTPLRQKRPAARALGAYAALAPAADVRDAAKDVLADVLDGETDNSNTARSAIAGYETVVEYNATRVARADVELLEQRARSPEQPLVRQDAIECLSNIVIAVDRDQEATAAFDSILTALERRNMSEFGLLTQRVERVFGQLVAADVPEQVDRALREKCRTYIVESTDERDAAFGVDLLREAASTMPPSTALDACRETVIDGDANWDQRLVAAESAVTLAPDAPDDTVLELVRALVDVVASDAERVTLTTVFADQCRDLIGAIDDLEPISTMANQLSLVLVDGSRASPLRYRCARLLERLVRVTGGHPFSAVDIGVLASMVRFEGTDSDVREVLLSLVPKLLETLDRPGFELHVVNVLNEAAVGHDDADRLTARMRLDQALRELLLETTSPTLQASILMRFRRGTLKLPTIQQMPSVIGLVEYVDALESRRLRRQLIEEFVSVVLDPDENESAQFGAVQAIKILVEETTTFGFDPGVVESLYRLVEAPRTSAVADEPLALRQRGVGAFSTALATVDDIDPLVDLASDVADRADDADPTVARSLLAALAVFATHDSEAVASHSGTLHRGVQNTDLEASLRCRLIDAIAGIETTAATTAATASYGRD